MGHLEKLILAVDIDTVSPQIIKSRELLVVGWPGSYRLFDECKRSPILCKNYMLWNVMNRDNRVCVKWE